MGRVVDLMLMSRRSLRDTGSRTGEGWTVSLVTSTVWHLLPTPSGARCVVIVALAGHWWAGRFDPVAVRSRQGHWWQWRGFLPLAWELKVY